MELYDFDSMDNDDLIGEAKVSIKDLENREEKDLWLEIVPVRPEKASHKVWDCQFAILLDVAVIS